LFRHDIFLFYLLIKYQISDKDNANREQHKMSLIIFIAKMQLLFIFESKDIVFMS